MMMMIRDPHWPNPTVQIPTYDYLYLDDPTAQIHSPISYNNSTNPSPEMTSSNIVYNEEYLAAFQCCDDNSDDFDFDLPVDAFSCDEFRMYEFKVTKCTRATSHDWTKCPYAHPGEKARRRDPKRYNYSGTACPEFRKAGECKKGSACEYAHGVFECWLHPARYRTQTCKDGTHCRRRVCFFAHKPEQLRTRSEKSTTSSAREVSPPTASSPTNNSGSPPPRVSPLRSMSLRLQESKPSMRGLYNKKKLGLRGMGMGLTLRPPVWDDILYGSPQSPTRIMSIPSTPVFANWDEQEEPVIMERVASGRELREKIYAKLEKENSLDRTAGRIVSEGSEPDIGWVSELLM